MALDAGFMASLMKIPYFKQLADTNGQEWLESVFEVLETDSYDFSQFETTAPASVSLSIDDAIKLDLHDLEIDKAQEAAAAAGVSEIDAKIVDTKPESEKSDEKQAIAAMAADHQDVPSSEAASDTDTSGRKFDNVLELPDVEMNSELIRRNPAAWVMLHNPPESWSAHSAESAVVVGLNDDFEHLKLSAFDDKIFTDEGNGNVTVNAGEGTDTLYLTTGGLTARLDGKSDFGRFGGTVELRNVENVIGSDGDDKIFGDGGDNKLVGGLGDDRIDGGGGDDTITGGAGKNNLSGGEGADTISGGNDDDVISGGAGNDKLDGARGDDKISGGGGTDTIDGGSGSDNISGGEGDDDLTGGTGDDDISGDAGNDTIDAGGGADKVDGGDGDDTIDGGSGNDKLDGGDGADDITGGDGDDTIDGGIGNDTIDGGDGDDKIDGGDGADEIDGGIGDDEIDGGKGDDEIDGGDGKDVILGGAGADTIIGGKGDDTITGGLGADEMSGGEGKDVYVYTVKEDSGTATDSFDIISDFVAADDKFDLTALLENDTFDFIAAENGAFTGNGPEVRWDKNAGSTFIEIDIDGNGTADMKIELDDEMNLTAANFSL